MNDVERVFYIGRFQPYHNGHQSVLFDIAETTDEIVIGIGSAQLSHEPDNPFTAGERILMINRALKELSCPFYIIPIEDIGRNALWVSHVRSMAPPFHLVRSGNPLVVRLFTEAGIAVQTPAMYERETHSGTEIRSRMVTGRPWEDLVPLEVCRVIKELDGERRVRALVEDEGSECRV
jgi:nicotinamide-nucleotide adenylyltransferase